MGEIQTTEYEGIEIRPRGRRGTGFGFAAGPGGFRLGPWGQWVFSSSTSKISVALGGMTPPAPWAP